MRYLRSCIYFTTSHYLPHSRVARAGDPGGLNSNSSAFPPRAALAAAAAGSGGGGGARLAKAAGKARRALDGPSSRGEGRLDGRRAEAELSDGARRDGAEELAGCFGVEVTS